MEQSSWYQTALVQNQFKRLKDEIERKIKKFLETCPMLSANIILQWELLTVKIKM